MNEREQVEIFHIFTPLIPKSRRRRARWCGLDARHGQNERRSDVGEGSEKSQQLKLIHLIYGY